jgi:PAS domain S-box-containing protein
MPAKAQRRPLARENGKLRARLEEMEETLRAIRSGDVDALVVETAGEDQVFTLKSADQTYRLMVEEMQMGAATLADDGVVLYCNPFLAALLDVPVEAALGAPLSGFLDEQGAISLSRLLHGAESGVSRGEVSFRRAGGSVPTQVSLTLLPLEGARVFSMIVTDLTERKRREAERAQLQREQLARAAAEEANRVAQEEIERRMRVEESLHHAEKQRSELLERERIARTEAEEANRLKDEFLATLSHELRNPLAPLHSSLFLLQRAEPGSDQANRMLAIMDRQIGQLTTLTNDLLDVTRISRGKITLQCSTVDLCALVRSAAEDNRALLAGHALRQVLEVPDEPLPVYADPARLSQVIGNLLHNAAKFTQANGEVTLALERSPDSKSARLIVRDTGAGMDPELLSRVFDPFFQGDRSLARSQGGLGLGLALVKALVEMHGGRVEASSEGLGHGSTFTVEIPLCEEVRESTPPPVLLPRVRRRVLVIEDNLDAANSLRAVLELLGHRVETASDGRLGLSCAREFRPEVVFCDIGLPEMDGYAVARALRDEVQLRDAVLVAMTGYAQLEDKRRATEAGFHEHLAKPPSIERLEEVLSRVSSSLS